MSRVIKFRGMRKGVFIFGSYVTDGNGYHSIHSTIDGDDENMIIQVVDPETVGQFTGLKDVNGTEIYEGDVVDLGQTVNGCNKFIVKVGTFGIEVEYAVEMNTPRNYEYCIKGFFAIDANTGEGLTVVNNIHEA